jgi:hypothetical protein
LTSETNTPLSSDDVQTPQFEFLVDPVFLDVKLDQLDDVCSPRHGSIPLRRAFMRQIDGFRLVKPRFDFPDQNEDISANKILTQDSSTLSTKVATEECAQSFIKVEECEVDSEYHAQSPSVPVRDHKFANIVFAFDPSAACFQSEPPAREASESSDSSSFSVCVDDDQVLFADSEAYTSDDDVSAYACVPCDMASIPPLVPMQEPLRSSSSADDIDLADDRPQSMKPSKAPIFQLHPSETPRTRCMGLIGIDGRIIWTLGPRVTDQNGLSDKAFKKVQARRARVIARYLEKRSRRSFVKSEEIMYKSRKAFADRRPRVHGRFV